MLTTLLFAVRVTVSAFKAEAASYCGWKLEKIRERFCVCFPLSLDLCLSPKLFFMSLLIFHCILTPLSACLKAAGIVCPFSKIAP